jgi:4-hydroxyphenylpyruvate dioxygenase-like putative hemolysin
MGFMYWSAICHSVFVIWRRLSANLVVNQNPMSLVMATLFMREHNRCEMV